MFLRRPYSTMLRATARASPLHHFNPEAIQDALNRTHPSYCPTEPFDVAVELPYFVARTSLGKNLPVYVDHRHGGSMIITVIRRIHGDPGCLAADLRGELPAGTEFRVRPELQQVIVKGRHVQQIRDFLTHKGF
jgi:translation initiation factor 1 (eIF-1/SUI1)